MQGSKYWPANGQTLVKVQNVICEMKWWVEILKRIYCTLICRIFFNFKP